MSVVAVEVRWKFTVAVVAAALLSGCASNRNGLSRLSTMPSGQRPILQSAAPAAIPAASTSTVAGGFASRIEEPEADAASEPPATEVVTADDRTGRKHADVAPLFTGAINGAPLFAGSHFDKGSELPLFLEQLPEERRLPRTAKATTDIAVRTGGLADIVRHTLSDNPEIGIVAAQLEGEKHAVEIARAGFRPTVNLTAAHGAENYSNAEGTYTGTPRTEYGIDLHQTLYDFGRTSYDVARHKSLRDSAAYRHLQKVNDISRDVASAYLRILEADEQIGVAEANVASHEEIHRMVEAQQKAGNASLADVKRVTARLEKARTGLIDLRSRRQNAREEFAGVTGLEPGALAKPPRLPLPLPPAGMNKEDYPDNPELMSVRADIDSLRMQANVAKANLEPSIDLDITGGRKENTSGLTGETNSVKGMISFNYKLMDGDARLNTARQVYARVEETKQVYRKKRRDYVLGLDNAVRSIRTNLEKSRSLDSRLADSRKVMELDKAQFKDGNKTLFELLDAQMDLYGAESEAIANRYSILQSSYEIFALRGDLVARLLDGQPQP